MEIPEKISSLESNFRNIFSLNLSQLGLKDIEIESAFKSFDIYRQHVYVNSINSESVRTALNQDAIKKDIVNLIETDGNNPITRIWTLPNGKALSVAMNYSFIKNISQQHFIVNIQSKGSPISVSIPNGSLGRILSSIYDTYQIIDNIQNDPIKLESFVNDKEKKIVSGFSFSDPFGAFSKNQGKEELEGHASYSKYLNDFLPLLFNSLPSIIDNEGKEHKTEYFTGALILSRATVIGRGLQFVAELLRYSPNVDGSIKHSGVTPIGIATVNPSKNILGTYNINIPSFATTRSLSLAYLGYPNE